MDWSRVWGVDMQTVELQRRKKEDGQWSYVLVDPTEEMYFIEVDLDDLLALLEVATAWRRDVL